MKTFYTLLLLLAINAASTFAQATFQKVYSSFYDQSGKDVLPTPDGGYILAGMTTNNTNNDMDVYLVKTNNLGDTLWTRSYGGAKPDYPNSILATSDGNYLVVGYTQSFGGGDYDVYLLKVKPSGDTLWTKKYGTWGNEQGNEIVATSDGNYMIVGVSKNTGTSNHNAMLIKISPSGNMIWTKHYGGAAYEAGLSVKQCNDGGYIMTGQTFSYGNGGGDVYLVKTNASGDTTWTKTYGGSKDDEGVFVLANNDGTFVIAVRDSSTGAGDVDVQVIKTNSTGGVIWSKTYGGSKKDTDKMIQPTTDGGYIIAAHSRSFGWVNPDMWLVKIDSGGDTLWTRHFGGYDHEHCYAVRQTIDGGYIVVGHTESYSTNNLIMLIKLNSLGKFGTVGTEDLAYDAGIKLYPNPSSGSINIEMGNFSEASITINNTLGETIYSETLRKDNAYKTIDLKEHSGGIYFLRIESDAMITTKKFILD